MATANDIRTGALNTEGLGFFKSITERVSRYRVYKNTIAELSELNDHDLSDLGLSRATIRSAAYEVAYAK